MPILQIARDAQGRAVFTFTDGSGDVLINGQRISAPAVNGVGEGDAVTLAVLANSSAEVKNRLRSHGFSIERLGNVQIRISATGHPFVPGHTPGINVHGFPDHVHQVAHHVAQAGHHASVAMASSKITDKSKNEHEIASAVEKAHLAHAQAKHHAEQAIHHAEKHGTISSKKTAEQAKHHAFQAEDHAKLAQGHQHQFHREEAYKNHKLLKSLVDASHKHLQQAKNAKTLAELEEYNLDAETTAERVEKFTKRLLHHSSKMGDLKISGMDHHELDSLIKAAVAETNDNVSQVKKLLAEKRAYKNPEPVKNEEIKDKASIEKIRESAKKIEGDPKIPFHMQLAAKNLLAKGDDDGKLEDRFEKAMQEHNPVTEDYTKTANAPLLKGHTPNEFIKPSPAQLSDYAKMATNKDLPLAVEMSAQFYTHHGDQHMNRLLRGHDDRDGLAGQKAGADCISALDAYTRANRLEHDIVLHRGFSLSQEAANKLATVGNKFKDDGYTSTSVDESVAQNFLYNSHSGVKVLMEIQAPKGTHAAYITPHSHYDNEAEFLIARGGVYETVSSRMSGNGSRLWVTVRVRTPEHAPELPKGPDPKDIHSDQLKNLLDRSRVK